MLRNFSLVALLIAAAVFSVGCGGSKDLLRPKQELIDEFMRNNPDLPQVDQSCIADGRFEIGMLAATVRFMLGEPTNIDNVQQRWARQEHWRYTKGRKTRLFVIEGKHVVGIDEYSGKR
ncbi:MAG: hypothetical protein LBC70_08460 [Chitinispirillales bacterium]|jgi:hypothetical protein|nr:hypothetical protein [Chitinispirillales bacterium]